MKQCLACGTVLEDSAKVCPNCGKKAKTAPTVVPMQRNVTSVPGGKDGYPVVVKCGLPVNGFGTAGLTFAVISLGFFWLLVPQIVALIFSAIGIGNARRRCCNFSAVWGIALGMAEVVLFVCLAVVLGIFFNYLRQNGLSLEEYLRMLFETYIIVQG